jgi:hypothetical protein
MREPPEEGPLQDPEASLEDIRHAFESLTEADWVKLDTYSENRVRKLGISASGRDGCHLFMEAMSSLETGRRHWTPSRVDLVRFMIDAMWSISSNWARRKRVTGYVHVTEADLLRYSEQDEELGTALDLASAQDGTPEEQLIRAELQTEEDFLDEIKKLFADRPLAYQIFDGWRAEMKGPEIIEVLGISDNQYRTETRLVRRRIQARWPEGIPDVR